MPEPTGAAHQLQKVPPLDHRYRGHRSAALFLYRCNWIAFRLWRSDPDELGISEDCLPAKQYSARLIRTRFPKGNGFLIFMAETGFIFYLQIGLAVLPEPCAPFYGFPYPGRARRIRLHPGSFASHPTPPIGRVQGPHTRARSRIPALPAWQHYSTALQTVIIQIMDLVDVVPAIRVIRLDKPSPF